MVAVVFGVGDCFSVWDGGGGGAERSKGKGKEGGNQKFDSLGGCI